MNLMQRIAGVFVMIFLAATLQSCGFIEELFGVRGKMPSERSDDKKDDKSDVVIKEVEWKEVTGDQEVIRNYPEREDEKVSKERYDVLCFLPLSGSNAKKGLSLYAGLKMAAESSVNDVQLRITTFDTNRENMNTEMMRKLFTSPEYDLVIAPYATKDVDQIVKLTKGSGVPVLSPWNTSPTIDRQATYIQLTPGLESHLTTMVYYAQKEFGKGRTIVIGQRKDADLMQIMEKTSPDLEVFYTGSNPRQDAVEIEQTLLSRNVQAIIVPSWRSSDQAYFLSLLSVINVARGEQPVHVFVLSSWMNNDGINYDQYRDLNLHFTNSRYVDLNRGAIKRFEESYFKKYQYFADDDVFYGHDIYELTAGLLSQYQFSIPENVVNFNCRDCFFEFDFVDRVGEQGASYILNDHVDIISFRDLKYRRVN